MGFTDYDKYDNYEYVYVEVFNFYLLDIGLVVNCALSSSSQLEIACYKYLL